MPFPEGWPPQAPAGYSRLRFFREAATTLLFADRAWLFWVDQANKALPYVAPGSTAPVNIGPGSVGGGRDPHDAQGGLPVPVPVVTARFIYVWNDSPIGTGAVVEVSFDGSAVHDAIYDTEVHVYEDRRESGISVRSKAGTPLTPFRILAF